MDVAYNQHSPYSKRNSRSATNLNHLSLAPLTSKLPLTDHDVLPEVHLQLHPSYDHHRTSYIEGRSAPTTPGILSRSSSRASLRRPGLEGVAKSKSSTNIHAYRQHLKTSSLTPGGRAKRGHEDFNLVSLTAADRNDSDWLLRAGALISTGAQESKGQTWLVSRASSTSLTAKLDDDEEELEQELARERESRRSSRRGSATGAFGDADDEFSPVTTRMSFGPGSRSISRFGSHSDSRTQSRRGSKVNIYTPLAMTEKERGGYFDAEEEFVAEPDFVDIDEDVFEGQQALDDEKIVRRLAKRGTIGLGSWVERLMGWSLFAVEEDGEDSDVESSDERDEMDDNVESASKSRSAHRQNLDDLGDVPEEPLPPPGAEEGGWQDAAWLLTVATKVLL